MIRCSYTSDPFSGCEPRSWSVAWSPCVSARSLLPEEGGECVACWRNGELVEGDDWDRELLNIDRLQFVEAPGIIPAIGFAQAAVFGAQAAATAATVASFGALKLLGTLAASLAIGKLLGPKVKPLTQSDQDSATYRFGGITSNKNAEGAPIPVLYGSHDVGGLEIAKYTATSVDGTDLWVLLLLSDGPIESVGGLTADADNLTSENGDLPEGLQINGQPAGNYDGIRCWVRLGTEEQTAIPGFESSVVQYEVDQTLLESLSPGPDNVELTPGVYDPTDPTDLAELDKWDTAITHDFATEIDAFEALIDFPGGLYATGSGAALANNQAKFQVRYRQLNGGGTPTGDYIVLPTETTVQKAASSPFTVAFRHDTIDYTDYAPPVPGLYATMGASAYGQIATPTGFVAKQKSEVEATVIVWARNNNADGVWVDLFSHLSATAGWSFEAMFDTTPAAGASPSVKFRWTYGEGASQGTWVTQTTPWDADGGIHQFAFVYRYKDAGQANVDVYIDGAYRLKTFTDNPMVLATTTAIDIANGGAWDVDDFRYWQKSLTHGEIAGQYAGGVGAVSSGTETGIVVSVDFDTVSAVSAADATVNGNTVVFAGGAAISSVNTGVVTTQDSGTPLRSRYRVEIQRLDEDDGQSLDQSEAQWASAKAILFDEFRYPGAAMLGVRIRATDQLSGSAPTVTAAAEGRYVPVWDGVDEKFPSFSFDYSRNPAWIALDLATNEEHGLGPYFLLERDPILSDFKTLADFCDEWVPTGFTSFDTTDASSIDYTYSAGVATLTFIGVTSFPEYAVGDGIAIQGFSFPTWDGDDGEAIELTAVDYTVATSTLVLTGTWYTNQGAPTPTSVSGAPLGTIEKREKRYLYDGVFDRPEYGAWDALVAVLQTCHAKPVLNGRRLGVFIDRPRDSVGIIGMGGVVEGSFSTSYSSVKERPNVVAIEILDRDDGYERTWVEREHSTVTDPTSQETFRRQRLRRDGVTRRSQALRDATRQLNISHILNRNVTFGLETEGLYLRVGDRFGLAHDVPGWGTSGRLRSSASTTVVTLDREVVIDGSSTYELTIWSPGTGAAETQVVSTGAGTYAAGDSITVSSAFSFTPATGDQYSFGVEDLQIKDFQVTNISADPGTLRRTIEAIEYSSTVYDDDFGEILESPSTLTPPPSEDDIPNAPASMSVAEGNDPSGDGTAGNYIDVSWSHHPDTIRNVAGTELWLQEVGVGEPYKVADIPGLAERHRIAQVGLEAESTYKVYVRPYSRNRRMVYVKANPYATITLEGLGQPPNKPISFGTLQATDKVVYTWSPGSARYRLSDELRTGGWILGFPIGQAVKGAGRLGPTASWLTLPTSAAGRAAPDILVRSLGYTGQPGRARASSVDFDPPGEVVYDSSLEDEGTGWTGATLSNMVVTGTSPSATVGFTGSNLAGYIEWDVTSLPCAGWYYVFFGYEADQLHPRPWSEATETWGSIEAQRWTWEGPIFGDYNGTANITRRPLVTFSDTTSVATSGLQQYVPGLNHFRSMRFRLQFNRPDSSLDVEVRRMAIRIVKPYDQHRNPMASEAFE